jgi:hypothetical protein
MDSTTPLAKAQLQEVDTEFKSQINKERAVTVQFNPETLKVSFANQIVAPAATGTPPQATDQNGTPARQFVGAGTTKLALQLWFDVTAPSADQETDVRKLTAKVAYFITPRSNGGTPPTYIPPAVRFLWGSFQFDGLMESMEESLEFFSSDGVPLRASVSLALSQQKIQEYAFGNAPQRPAGALGTPSGGAPGTSPLVQAAAGATLQGIAASLGGGASWQAIAAANNIENPRLLQPGQLIDLSAQVSLRGGVS